MRLDPDRPAAQGEDAGLLHFIDIAFGPGAQPGTVGVAVSGGGDSMALLHLAWRWSGLTGVPVAAVTVDHGLRPEAAEEAALVAAFCAPRGIPHDVLRWRDRPATGNLMAAARDARYRLISGWARGRGIGHVFLGHTADDIAETFLMRLARRAGVDGLAMMEARFDRHGILWARPLWQQSRADLRDYLTRQGLSWVEDPTNADDSRQRTRARAALAALRGLGIDAEVLKDVSLHMLMARGALDYYAAEEAGRLVHIEGGDLVLDRRPRPPVPPEIERRLLSAAIRWVGRLDYPPRGGALLRLDADLALGGSATLGGCLVTAEQGGKALRIAREHAAVAGLTGPTDAVWDRHWKLEGPHAPDLHVAALGEAVPDCPDWRGSGLPRASLMASPAVWRGTDLVAAPLAGLGPDWTAQIVTPFAQILLSR